MLWTRVDITPLVQCNDRSEFFIPSMMLWPTATTAQDIIRVWYRDVCFDGFGEHFIGLTRHRHETVTWAETEISFSWLDEFAEDIPFSGSVDE